MIGNAVALERNLAATLVFLPGGRNQLEAEFR